MAFPSHVMGTFLPKPEWIGERSSWLNSSWGHLADALFAGKPPDLSCSMEHDDQLVSRHVHVCLGSYEPSHQDKIVGVAFLLAVWMDVEWPAEEQARAAELLNLGDDPGMMIARWCDECSRTLATEVSLLRGFEIWGVNHV